MQDQGVVPRGKLDPQFIETPQGSIGTVKNLKPSDQPQEWVSVTFKATNVATVTAVATDKSGKKLASKTITVTDPTKPFTVVFDEPVQADKISVNVIAKTEGAPTNVDVVSAVACVRAADETTPVSTTTPAQTPVPTTVPVPGTTIVPPTTSSAGQTTVAPTTTAPGTTPASKPKPVCLQQMGSQGIVPKDKLKVERVPAAKSTTLTVESPTKDDLTPVWVGLTLASPSGNAKVVTVTALDKDNRPVGDSETKKVSDPTKPITLTFSKPIEAKKILVTVTPSTDKPSDVDLVSAEACIYSKVATTTPAAGTTTPVPVSTTTSLPASTTTTAPKPNPTPLVCTSPLEGTECLCHRTCDSLAETVKCAAAGSAECHRGCQCPSGTVMQNGKCIKEIDCPCYYKGKFYKTNEKVPVPGVLCTHMICTQEGMKKVVDKECKPDVTCSSGRVFQICPCERSCQDDKHKCDQTTCEPSCACPVDTLWNGVKCVAKAQCTCLNGNTTYSDGQSWDFGECSKCHCVNGQEKCSEICRITAEDCKKQGKKLLNKDLRDGVCCRCVSEEPHCLYHDEEKKIGDEWHEGLCTNYKCSMTAVGTGMIVKTKTECAECEEGEVKEYVANKCCPVCRKKSTLPVTPKLPDSPVIGEKCSEVMKDTKEMNDKRITLQPAKDSKPTDISPRGKGWTVSVADKPTITLDLSTDKGQRPGVLQTIRVLGNAKSVTIKYIDVRPRQDAPEDLKEYNKGKPIDVESSAIRLVGPSGIDGGLTVYKVQITVVEAVDKTKPLKLRLQVHACIEDAPEPCDENDLEELVCTEIMRSPQELPDKRINLKPSDKGSAADLRPSGEGWLVDEDDKPSVTINLASKDGQKPGLIEKLAVIGNVKTAIIEYRPVITPKGVKIQGASNDGFLSYNDGKPVVVEKEEVILKNPVTQKSGLIAFDVRITPVKPVVEEEPFNLKLKVYACIQVDYNDVKEPEEPEKPKKDTPEDKPKKDEPTGCTKVLENGELPEDRITLTPKDKGTPKDLLPSGKGWPVTKDDKPSVTIDFSSPNGRKPGLVDKITVLGNVKTVTVEIQEIRPRKERKIQPNDKLKPDGFQDLKDGKPVDVEKKPVVFKDPITDKPGRVLYRVRITPVEPINPDKPMNMRLRIVACVQDKTPTKDITSPKDPKTPKTPKTEKNPDSPDKPKKPEESKIGCTKVMENGDLPVTRITLTPTNKGTPKDLLPSGKGWPVTKDDKPSVTLNIASPDGKKPGLLENIKVTGNVKTVKVEVMKIRPRPDRKIKPGDEMDPQGFKKYDDKPIDVTEKPIVFTSKITKKPGVLVYQVRITPVEPVDPTKPFDLKLSARACIQDKITPSTPTKPKKPESTGCTKVMENGELAGNRITLKPSDKGTPKDLLPSGKGWPVTKDDKPSVTLNLASPDGKKPGLLENLKVTGNVKTVTVKVLKIRPSILKRIKPVGDLDPQGFKDFNNGQPIDVTKTPVVFKSSRTNKPGVLVYKVQITPVEPVDPTKPFDLKLSALACIQDESEPKPKSEPKKLPENNGCVDVMKDPEELPDKQITLKPTDKGTPSVLRPDGNGWPVTPKDKPVIHVNLASPDNRKPGLLRKIKVLGNVREVTVRFRTIRPRKDRKIQTTDKIDAEGFQDYNGGKPIQVNQIEMVFLDPVSKKPGRMIYDVEVTLVEPIYANKPFHAKLEVYACIQNDLEIITKNDLQELIAYIKAEKLATPVEVESV